jgi:hypothetical protein
MTTATATQFASSIAADLADTHAVTGAPRVVLRLEGALVLLAATAAYAHLGVGWKLFAALFLVPDLSMLGYLLGRRVGAAAYNTGHSYIGPALLAAAALWAGHAALLPVALIWIAHIGFDRMLGYGLKYGSTFGATHLGSLGRRAA